MKSESTGGGRIGQVCWFFVVGYGIGWGVDVVLRMVAAQSGLEVSVVRDAAECLRFEDLQGLSISPWLAYLLTRCQDFSFTLSAVVMIGATGDLRSLKEIGQRLIRWRIGWWWYAMASLPIVFYMTAVLVAEGAGGAVLESSRWDAATLQMVMLSAEGGLLTTLLLRGPMGEEPGLRGYALVRLRERYSAFRCSVILGLVWGLWHLPVLIERELVVVLIYLAIVLGLGFVFTWLFERSGGSLIPVLLFHGLQNSDEVYEMVFPALQQQSWELPSSALLLLLGIVAAVLLWRQGNREAREVAAQLDG